MGAAGGLVSPASDLSMYYKALMKAWRGKETAASGKEGPFGDVS